MDISNYDRKSVGNLGEVVAAEYLRRNEFKIIERNRRYKAGELDIVAKKESTLHIIEVKTLACAEFPSANPAKDAHDPSANLHAYKLKKVARATEWYCAEIEWVGDIQIDGILVWLRLRDGLARVRYLPQIL